MLRWKRLELFVLFHIVSIRYATADMFSSKKSLTLFIDHKIQLKTAERMLKKREELHFTYYFWLSPNYYLLVTQIECNGRRHKLALPARFNFAMYWRYMGTIAGLQYFKPYQFCSIPKILLTICYTFSIFTIDYQVSRLNNKTSK